METRHYVLPVIGKGDDLDGFRPSCHGDPGVTGYAARYRGDNHVALVLVAATDWSAVENKQLKNSGGMSRAAAASEGKAYGADFDIDNFMVYVGGGQ